jgi:uncharacterized protein (DUF433 family)
MGEHIVVRQDQPIGTPKAVGVDTAERQLVVEIVGGEPYEFWPLGQHVVSAPGICGGRPTFKYTRIDVRHAVSLLAGGWTVDAVAHAYEVPVDAVREALELGMQALAERTA